MRISSRVPGIAILSVFALTGCSSEETAAVTADTDISSTSESAEAVTDGAQGGRTFAWPASLRVMGDGYPTPGDPCRRLGETAATSNYLDDSVILIGCPDDANSAAVSSITRKDTARVVGETEGVTLISIAEVAAAARATEKHDSGLANISGKITGNATATHRFTTKDGDTVHVTLKGPASMYFNVLPPGGTPGDAIYVGSRAVDDANSWSAVAPAAGEYSVIVYMMGNDKDSGATRSYELAIAKN